MENRIRELREKLSLSQEELSAVSGVSRTIISQLETGRRDTTTTKTLSQIAEALGVTMPDLFSESATINFRLKVLRDELELTQEAFARRLGTGRGVIMNIEYNKTAPKPAFVDLVCREFNVSEQWLRAGTGEMFRKESPDEKISAFVQRVLQSDSDSFERRVMLWLADLSPDEWKTLERILIRCGK